MRCLYCGKELALLKRLTGGAEFCSDAHRKRYQEEFNDLALSRLLQTQPVAQAKPLTPMEEPVSAAPVPLAEPTPIALAPPKPANVPPKPTIAPPKSSAPPPPSRTKAPEPAKAPEPKDPVVGITGYIVEQPTPGDAARAAVGGEPVFDPAIETALPCRSIVVRAMARASGLPLGDPLASVLTLKPTPVRIQPRAGNLEIREFSRQAIAPAAVLTQSIQSYESVLPGATGEAMEITNQPHPPADPPVLWQAGPHPAPPVNLLLGALARLDYGTTGFGDEAPAAPPAAEVAPPVEAQPEPQPEPPIPVQAAPVQAAPAPEPVTKPLPITLHGSGTGPAKPTQVPSLGVPPAIATQAPPSSALPLRPTIILAPRPAPKPVAAPVPEPVPTAPRPVRGPSPVAKNRRPEVRVVQTTAPTPQSAKPAPPPPVVQTAPPPAPVAKAPVAPPKPAKASAPELPPPAKTEPAPVRAEVDLHLPELHNPEVQGAWARMPVALKAGMGAVLALAIVGFAYSALNSSPATAKSPAVAAPSYELGKQINSGGWIEDWAPADKERRITLLRGSQPYSDYRMEFEAQIQNKAIGWMYRGLNAKNYYVVKLEKLKPGLEPVVALVRYAVIDGENEKRVEKILPMKVRVDTTYKIRFDAVGNEFAVWVQDKKVDEWKDTRLGSGGLGLYAEGEEAAAVHGTVNVYELVSTK